MSVRVAAVQLGIEGDAEGMLQRCLAGVGRAAGEGARAVVLPEFCTYSGAFASHEEVDQHAQTMDGPFLAAIAGAAGEHKVYVALALAVREPSLGILSRQLLFSPDGELLGCRDKDLLFGPENDCLAVGKQPLQVFDTELGRLALCSGSELIIPETGWRR
jgi:predicted amidohydrolase